MAKYFFLFFSSILLAVASVSCGYDEVESDAVTEIHIMPFNNAGELPVPLGDDASCPRSSLLLWLSFSLADYADVAHLASPMVELRIITLTDLADGFPAGSDVSSLFMIHPIRPEISHTDFDSYDYDPVRFSLPSPQQPLATVYREGAYFMLMAPPAEPQQCQFVATAFFADGSSLSATTDFISLF